MTDSILCPNCKHKIPLSEAITHELGEKHQKELEELKKKSTEREQYLIELSKKRIEEEKEKSKKEAEIDLRKKISEEMEFKMKNAQNESDELKKNNKALQDQLLELSKTIRQLQNQTREKELEMAKKMNEEQEEIRKEEQKRIEEQYKLKDMEKDKKLRDVIRINEDLKRKLEQGSQQTQGEVLELEVENTLKKEFPLDLIEPIAKGITGADLSQTVKNLQGKKAGTIIWEMKRTKSWSQQWIEKLKSDQRTVHAEIAVLISEVIPGSVNKFGQVDGVWVCDFESYLGLAYALRSQLLELATLRNMHEGKQGKMEMLYRYMTSVEFKHRVEAIIEAFTNMQQEVEKERRWFTQKWAREEKHLRSAIDNTIGMSGDLQSVIGKSLTEKKVAEALPDGKDENDENSTLF